MIEKGTIAYFAKEKGYYKNATRSGLFKSQPWDGVFMLWGDRVYVIDIVDQKAKVSSKGHHFEIPLDHLMETPLFQLYQIDCGQGDATLVNLPDGRWILVDGGPPRNWSNTGKIAIDFLFWKLFVDYSWRREFNAADKPFHLDALICTHPDYDHYGGLMELTKKINPNDPQNGITIGTVFHNGLGRFSGPYTKYQNGAGFSQLGPLEGGELPEAYLTTLIDGFDDVRKYSEPEPGRDWVLDGSYTDWLKDLAEKEGRGVGKLKRAHFGQQYLEGFGPGNGNPVPVKILGPVQESFNGKMGFRYLDAADKTGGPSLTRNGISVVTRLDYKNLRVLLTGDLNFNSQALLFNHVPAQEFSSHVAKACHHGSEDVSWKFLQAMDPIAVLFSSGDNEGYAHPRAKVLGWSGAFGRKTTTGKEKSFLQHREQEYDSPLIYSTELSRSVNIWDIYKVLDKDGNEVKDAKIQPRGRTKPGSEDAVPYSNWLLADKLIYGLINVRSDGEKVVIGVLKENLKGFQVESFKV